MRGRIRIDIDSKALDRMTDKISRRGAEMLGKKLDTEMGVTTRNMALMSALHTPVLTGALQASIRHSPRRVGKMAYIYGSYMPYATRRNYSPEYSSGLYFMEKGYWYTKDAELKRISEIVRRTVT